MGMEKGVTCKNNKKIQLTNVKSIEFGIDDTHEAIYV